MDEGSNRAVRTMFKRLYDDGLIYRAERMVNWSPALRSVLSDIEVEHKEVDGELVSIRYGDGDDAIVVATTRVETMLGDTAVAVHPDDERYRHLVGREIELPLVGRRIPILADDHVDPDVRHRRGEGHARARPERLRDRPPARPADAVDHGRERRHHRHRHRVRRHGPVRGAGRGPRGAARAGPDRRGEAPVPAQRRPLPARAARADRAAAVAAVVRQGRAAGARPRATRCATATSSSTRRSSNRAGSRWVDNMHDWCISRQLWWGHRIPVWYGPARRDGLPRAGRGAAGRLDAGRRRPRHLVLLGAVAVLHAGLAGRHPGPAAFYPTSVLVTGYDILFFWVARMMMFGLYAMDGAARRSTPSPCTAWSATSTARRCRSRRATRSTRWTWMDQFGADARAVRAGPRRQPGHGPAARRRRRRRRAQLRHQAVQRHPVRAGQRRDGGAAAARRGGADRRRPLDPRAAGRGPRRRSTRCWTTSSSPRPPRRSTTSRGTSSATGTSSWPRCSCAPTRRTAPRRCSATSWTRCSSCCTRSSRSSPRRCGRR